MIVTLVTGFFTYKYFTSDETERTATITQIRDAIVNVAGDFGYKKSSTANRSSSNNMTVYADGFNSYWGLSASEYSEFTQEAQDEFWNRNNPSSIYNQSIRNGVAGMVGVVAVWADGLTDDEMFLDTVYEIHDYFDEGSQTIVHYDDILVYAKITCDSNNNIKMYLMRPNADEGCYEINLKYNFKNNSDYEIEYKNFMLSSFVSNASERVYAKKTNNKFEKLSYGNYLANDDRIVLGDWDFVNLKYLYDNNQEIELTSSQRTAIVNKIVDGGLANRVKANFNK